jgi:hypothetical protein
LLREDDKLNQDLDKFQAIYKKRASNTDKLQWSLLETFKMLILVICVSEGLMGVVSMIQPNL